VFLLDPADVASPIVYSPTDIESARCPYLLLRTLDAKLGRAPELQEPDDPMMRRAARLGEAHEERVLAAYVERSGLHVPGAPGGVAVIGQASAPVDGETDDERRRRYRDGLGTDREETIAALRDGADVVFQATFFDGRLSGRADFLVREDVAGSDDATPRYRWQVVDTKLTERSRASALLQLAAYADQLLALGFEVAPEVVIHHGSGTRTGHRLADLIEVFRAERVAVEALLDAHQGLAGPASWAEWGDPLGEPAELAVLAELSSGVEVLRRACGRCAACRPEVELTRDVALVHGIRTLTRTRLWAEGVRTIDDLATLTRPLPTLKPAVQERLVRQARLQRGQLAREALARANGERNEALPGGEGAAGAAGGEVAPGTLVEHEVIDAHLLSLLPAPSEGDLFFDFEGDPLWTESGAIEGGLEYLFGLVDAREDYLAFWAHDRAAEKQALEDFLAYLRERRRAHPDLHVYHFAAYEPQALTRLAERHDVGRGEVAALLRDGVFVDLYPVVRHTLAISQPSYGLKSLEPLYLGTRDADGLADGAASTEVYAAACAARAAGTPDEAARADELLGRIEEYNRLDCVSTKRLLEWLRSLAPAAGRRAPALSSLVEEDDVDGTPRTFPFPLRRTTRHLAWQLATAAGPAPRDADHEALALLGAALEYHQREELPYWRAHGERLAFPVDYWADQRDVLTLDGGAAAGDPALDGGVAPGGPARGTTAGPWEPRRTRFARELRVRGTLGAGTTPESWGDVVLLYRAQDVPGIAPEAGALHLTTTARATEASTDGDVATLVLEESAPAAFVARVGDALPVAVVPGAPIPTTNIHRAIVSLAERVAEARGELGPDAGLDLLRRALPRLSAASGLTELPVADPADPVPAITAATAALDRSVLAVQGPPGTGKTYVGARVIGALVREHGWRVGVVAQSHAVVEHLLDEIVTGAGVPPERVAKYVRGEPERAWTVPRQGEQAAFLERYRDGCVLGGTLWDLTNRRRVGEKQLDLLVVDEAGQLALANAVAASTSALRLLLLGDPQQLPQVTQGVHAEPVDSSALEWVAGGSRTLPADRGYFLERSWRMHSALTRAVSELSYDGRLGSAPVTDTRSLAGLAPGVHSIVLDHHGNATASPEEAAEVVRVVRDLLGRAWTDPASPAGSRERPLGQDDVLVVAPYNAQVSLVRSMLDAAGLDAVRVGTVDRFQGQEAVVAVVTLAASSGAEVARGLGFLLDRNRLNVAVSRAQWAAVVIRAHGLTDVLPVDGRALADLGGFQRIVGP